MNALLASVSLRCAIVIFVAGTVGALESRAAENDEHTEQIAEEIEALKSRIERLESRTASTSGAETTQGRDDGDVPENNDTESLPQAVPGSERASPDVIAPPEPDVKIGGALRFNYVYRDYSNAAESKLGESGLDVFRLNVDGQINNILISAEYRYYAYMQTIHHGWIGYQFSDDSQLQFGIHQVPFGLLPYAAHNAWFGVPYYVGLADDYDMGIKYVRSDGPWQSHIAFYKNEELNDATSLARYGFDVVQVEEQQSEEINRVNGRLAYTFGRGSGCETEVGGSAQAAALYDPVEDKHRDHWAGAAHLDTRCGRWNFQLEGVRYSYDTGIDNHAVRVGAFNTSYTIASRADIAVANIAYNVDPPWSAIDQLICYNDHSRLIKSQRSALDSQINTTGCAIGIGPVFSYVDFILARNMALFNDGSLASDGESQWHSRLNINIGFYW